MSTSQPKQDTNKKPETLEREADQARARLSQTVDALGNKLSPGEILDQALGMAREHGGEFASNLGSQVKQNPLPLLVTGVGMAWMMASSQTTAGTSQRSVYSDYDGHDDYAADGDHRDDDSGSGLGEKLAEGLSSAKDKMKGATDSVSAGASSAQQSARQQAKRAQEGLQTFFKEQPLVAGALGVALGASLGAVLPASEREDSLFGKQSDKATREATSVAHEQYDKARDSAQQAVADVEEAVTS